MKLLQLAAARTPAAATVGSNLLLRCNASTAAPTDAAALRTTPLDALHRRHGGRLVPFAGYALPVQYGRHGIAASHRHCRRSATLFDVSHMQQTRLLGRDAAACMESVCTADLSAGALPDGGATLTVLTTEAGGIVDDAIVTRVSADELFLVSNAGRKVEDRAVLEAAVERFRGAGKEVELVFVDSDERALVAVQGPRAVRVLQTLLPSGTLDLATLWFMTSTVAPIAGVPDCRISRCGYTGEDGVEISVPADRAAHLVEAFLDARRTADELEADRRAGVDEATLADEGDGYDGGAVRLAGLGARDTLRLEAGMCLYGSDIDEATNPVEAGLAWLVAKRRRAEANFPGAAAILDALRPGQVRRRRVGLRPVAAGAPPARHGVQIRGADDAAAGAAAGAAGYVTSGCPSPTLGGSVAMGYVPTALAKAGTNVQLEIRGKWHDAQVVKLPFVASHYYVNK